MRKYLLCLGLLTWLGSVGSAFANTNYVVAGGSLQAGINACSPGDTLVVQGAVYSDANVIFTNPITVLCSGTNLIQVAGAAAIQGSGPMYFAQCQFLNSTTMQVLGIGAVSFAQCLFVPSLQIVRGGTASFSQCQFSNAVSATNANLLMSQCTSLGTFTANLSQGGGTNFQAYDSTFANTFLIGGKTLLKRCSGNGLFLSGNAAFEGLRVTNYLVSGTATAGSGTPFLAVQSSFFQQSSANPAASLSGYNVWLGYSYFGGGIPAYFTTFQNLVELTNCNSVLIGNSMNESLGSGSFASYSASGNLIVAQGGSLVAYNNNTSIGCEFGYVTCLWLYDCAATIVNNTFVYGGGSGPSYGAFIQFAPTPTMLTADLFVNAGTGSGNGALYSGSSPQPTIASYCDIYDGYGAGTGVTLVNCTNVVPIFGPSDTLATNSPCIGAGPPDPIYFNYGTTNRNDIGFSGGPYYNPANSTNNNPIVFYLAGTPQVVFKGMQTNIQISAAATSGH